MQVSILVFLDMEFRRGQWEKIYLSYFSFNPCFSGYGIQTMLWRFKMRWTLRFNPCFSGYGIQTRSTNGRWVVVSWVSILVFLDMEFRPYIQSLSSQWITSFNPCFSGYGIQTRFQLGHTGFRNLFQSLFFWIWNSDSNNHRLWAGIKSFNPCFSGYGIQTFLHKNQRTSLLMVSILVFLDMEFRQNINRLD